MADGQLKSLFDRINRLLDEKAALTSDIADIYHEAKSAGFTPKVLRTVVRRARADQTKLAEEDELQALYEASLSGELRTASKMAAEGATSREIAAATGMNHATVARSVALKNNRATEESEKPSQDTSTFDEITGEIPPYLLRARA